MEVNIGAIFYSPPRLRNQNAAVDKFPRRNTGTRVKLDVLERISGRLFT